MASKEFHFKVDVPIKFWVTVEGTVRGELPDEEDAPPSCNAEDTLHDNLESLLIVQGYNDEVSFRENGIDGVTVSRMFISSDISGSVYIDEADVTVEEGE